MLVFFSKYFDVLHNFILTFQYRMVYESESSYERVESITISEHDVEMKEEEKEYDNSVSNNASLVK